MRRGLALVALLVALAVAGVAHGERVQRGTLIASLDGRISPLRLPRHHLAPVAVHLQGGLQTSDGSLLPRAKRIELGLPKQGVLSTRGLPLCPLRRLRDLTRAAALAACRPALVGSGRLRARIAFPGQPPFWIDAAALAFNGRVDGTPAVILHAFAPNPPTVAVVPFLIRLQQGGFNVLTADLARSLGPWARLSRFSLTLHRRYSYRGRTRSYLSARCPAPPSFSGGYFFAKAAYRFAGGRRIANVIPRACQAR